MSHQLAFKKESYGGYRRRFLLSMVLLPFLKLFILGPACVFLLWTTILHLARLSSSSTFVPSENLAFGTWVTLYLVSIGISSTFTSLIRKYRNMREARKFGAQLVPRVRTGWPGNVDLFYSALFCWRKSYFMEPFKELFEKYGSTTLNLGLLWGDQVCIFLMGLDRDV
jgi:hypothetical protein